MFTTEFEEVIVKEFFMWVYLRNILGSVYVKLNAWQNLWIYLDSSLIFFKKQTVKHLH